MKIKTYLYRNVIVKQVKFWFMKHSLSILQTEEWVEFSKRNEKIINDLLLENERLELLTKSQKDLIQAQKEYIDFLIQFLPKHMQKENNE